jgi:hypothetical protein
LRNTSNKNVLETRIKEKCCVAWLYWKEQKFLDIRFIDIVNTLFLADPQEIIIQLKLIDCFQ